MKCRFVKFNISEFYPLIAMELLARSISFAKSLIDIEGNIINTINHARRSLLFDDSGAWVKKTGTCYSMSQWTALTVQGCLNFMDCAL